MKRSDIKVGDELYYDSGQDWRLPKHSLRPTGQKAIVVDLGPFRILRERWGLRGDPWVKDPTGTAVLADLHREGWAPKRDAVPTAHLRGPWSTVLAEISAALADRADERAAQRDERKAAVHRADMAVERGKQLGFWASVDLTGEPRITLDVQEFMRLLDRLDGAS